VRNCALGRDDIDWGSTERKSPKYVPGASVRLQIPTPVFSVH
jgi:hypothetical protein